MHISSYLYAFMINRYIYIYVYNICFLNGEEKAYASSNNFFNLNPSTVRLDQAVDPEFSFGISTLLQLESSSRRRKSMEKAQKETEEVSFSSQREEMDPAMV